MVLSFKCSSPTAFHSPVIRWMCTGKIDVETVLLPNDYRATPQAVQVKSWHGMHQASCLCSPRCNRCTSDTGEPSHVHPLGRDADFTHCLVLNLQGCLVACSWWSMNITHDAACAPGRGRGRDTVDSTSSLCVRSTYRQMDFRSVLRKRMMRHRSTVPVIRWTQMSHGTSTSIISNAS